MKVLVVLGIFILAATGVISYQDHEKYCCGKGYHNASASGINNTCITLRELVQYKTEEALNSTDKRKMLPELEIQTVIHEFSQAALKCIPNNRLYRNVHVIFDDLHAIIDELPFPKNVEKRIAEAHDYIDEHFDDLHPVRIKFSHLRERIDKFFEEHSRRAAEVFGRHHRHAEDARKVLSHIPLLDVTHDIIRRIDNCVGVNRTDVEGVFKCRARVRSLAEFMSDLMKEFHHKSRERSIPHRYSIESLLTNFTAEKRELEELIKDHEIEWKPKGNHHRD